jgi:AcrR family transcriptional regulator
MSTPTGGLRERKKQRTRRAIQRTAIELFAAQGFRETTIAQIADAAEVSLRTVTVHFPAKEDLILSLGSQGLDGMAEHLRSRPSDQTTLVALRAWIAGQISYATDSEETGDSGELIRLRHQVIERDPELRARLRGGDERIERVLAPEIARDLGLTERDLTPRQTAAAVATGLRMLSEPLLSGDELPRDPNWTMDLVDRIFAFAEAGISAGCDPRETHSHLR